MEQYLKMIGLLVSNFEFVQKKIDEITKLEKIDIKQISDLQRYTEMQLNIANTLHKLGASR